jgi:hypothetical protein
VPTDPAPAVPYAPPDPTLPAASGSAVLPGVVLLDPALDAATATATFSLRNDSGRDLPDLILAVVFVVDGAPRIETLEAPMRRGERRDLRATLAARKPEERPASFQVLPGLPERVAEGADGLPGTTFLGGRLECVELAADLTGERRQVSVGLAEREAPGAEPLPALEGQLIVGRAGDLVWVGPWILLPKAGAGGSKVRRVRWNLDGAPGLGACELFLRVREKR